MRKTIWVLLDARAHVDEDDAVVLMTGTRDEYIEARDSGDYGEDCVVTEWEYTEAPR